MDKQKIVILFFFISITIFFGCYLYIFKYESNKYAILINTWNDFPNAPDVNAYPSQILQAYDVLKSQGYKDDNIYLFFYHINNNIYYNGVIIDYENEAVNNSTFINMINNLSNKIRYNDEMLIYIVSHANKYYENKTVITFENKDTVNQDILIKYIKLIKCKKMIILLDFCYSGNLLPYLKAPDRIIITASDGNHQSWFYWNWNLTGENKTIYGDSGSAFFHPFWVSLKYDANYETAFYYGKEKCEKWGDIDITSINVTKYQNPQLFIGNDFLSTIFIK
jgi:hypothetical protein